MSEHPTRLRVLDAVATLAAEGIERVTIDAISETSGVANGSIYHHFGNRAGVLAAAAERAFADVMSAASPALDERTAEVCVRDFVGRYVAWIEQNPDQAALLYTVPLSVDLTDAMAGKRETFVPLLSWITAASNRGAVRDLDPVLFDPVVFGPVHEVARRWLASGRSSALSEIVPRLQDAVWRILQPEN